MRLIDADALIEFCAERWIPLNIDAVNMQPTIQPERKKGEWSDGYRWQRCSLCKQTGKKSWNYCPNCGANMKGEQDD